eukprot:Em0055g17a
MSRCRQNYDTECEAGIQQADQPGATCHVHLHAFYFERDDVDLKGFAKFFRDSAKEEFEHAEKFMKYQTERGGRIVLQDIKRPRQGRVGNWLSWTLHKVSDKHNDYHMSDFIEANFLGEQVESIKKISGYITNLKRVGPGHGEYHFDHETLGK